jgi:PAS domain S-box-containing protein
MKMQKDIRVLIVEDDALVCETIQGLLEGLGYTVAGKAANGPEAVEMTQSLRPDVVLMDIGLPEMNGIEASRYIHESCPTPVVVLTAYETPELLERASATGVGAYLVKPANAHEMERAITITIARFDDMMELRRLNAELQAEVAERKVLGEMWRKYDFIVNTSRDFMTLIGKNYTYEAVNESYCRAHNKTRGEIIGHTVADVWGEERFSAQIKENLDKCFAGNVVYYQAWFEFAALGLRCLDVAYYPYCGGEGRPTHVVVVSRDITEHKRAGEALQQYTERLKNLHEIDQAILATRSPEEIANAALSYLGRLVPCQQASLTVFDFEVQKPTLLAIYGDGETRIETEERLSLGASWIKELRRNEIIEVQDILAVPQPSPAVQMLRAEGLRSYVEVPLVAQGELVGVLNLAADSPDAFAPEHVAIAREVAASLAVAIQQARLFEQVRDGRERLQNLSRQLVEAQETERRHLARELHDEIGQTLTVLKIELQAIQRLPDTLPLASYLEESIGIAEQTLQRVRNLSLDLRPSLLDDLGLVPALRWYVDRQARRVGFAAQFAADQLEERLPEDVEITCFRVVQEALTNVVRHAQAQRVSVDLRRRGADLQVLICDDGMGFDVQKTLQRAARGASLGLLGMQERVLLVGGQIEIESAPQRGTEIRVRFPIK